MCTVYKKVELPKTGEIVGTGWLPPLPDFRDYTEEHPEIAPMAKKLGISPTKKPKALPPKVDLREWFSPVKNQGNLSSCSAHAGMAIVEYFENRAFDKYIDGSRLFLYKTTRNLMELLVRPMHCYEMLWVLWFSVVSLRKSIGPMLYLTLIKNPPLLSMPWLITTKQLATSATVL
jgi:C1A family cysteine protease